MTAPASGPQLSPLVTLPEHGAGLCPRGNHGNQDRDDGDQERPLGARHMEAPRQDQEQSKQRSIEHHYISSRGPLTWTTMLVVNPSALAVTTTEPGALAVTTPSADTEAIVGSLVDQDTAGG